MNYIQFPKIVNKTTDSEGEVGTFDNEDGCGVWEMIGAEEDVQFGRRIQPQFILTNLGLGEGT